MKKIVILPIMILILAFELKASVPVVKLNEDGSNYIKFGMTSQIWARYTEMNPGSSLYGTPVSGLFDISLRRTRFVVNGMLTDKTYFFVQFGQNNFNMKAAKYTGAFFHDVVSEYHFSDKLHVGGGLTGWVGLLRNASPSVGSILSLDAPLYQQPTHSVSDQFLRKLSLYAKGSLNRFTYRVAITNPMVPQQATTSLGTLSQDISSYSTKAPHYQYQGYFQCQLFEKESMLNPYTKGSYLGAKKVLALGAGFINQQDAMWLLNTTGDTTYQAMNLLGADIFFESKMDSVHNYSITAYGAYSYYDFGKNYLRNVGVNNPASGTTNSTVINGAGNNFPMIGTGHTLYAQLGYLTDLNNELKSKLQPYIAAQISNYNYLDNLMIMTEGGINWHIRGRHTEKLTLNYQNRPIFVQDPTSLKNEVRSRASMVQLQMQLGF